MNGIPCCSILTDPQVELVWIWERVDRKKGNEKGGHTSWWRGQEQGKGLLCPLMWPGLEVGEEPTESKPHSIKGDEMWEFEALIG